MVNAATRSQPKSHPVKLRGIQSSEVRLSGDAPTVLHRQDADPIEGVLADLMKSDLSAIAASQVTRTSPQDPWNLFQPVHRVFHLVLLEAICDPYQNENFQPRLDPQKIESAGLVLRRRVTQENNQTVLQGWRTLTNTSSSSTAKIEGWIDLPETRLHQDPEHPQAVGYTPLPEFNTSAARTIAGHRLTLLPSQQATLLDAVETAYTERTTPLFVAPPEVCDHLKKTILYGLIPLTSNAISQSQNAEEPFKSDFVQSHLNSFLQATPLVSDTQSILGSRQSSASQILNIGAANPFNALINQLGPDSLVKVTHIVPSVPEAGKTLTGITAAQLSKTSVEFRNFLSLLRQLHVEFEFNKLDPDTGKLFNKSQQILDTLNKIQLTYGKEREPAGDKLRYAARHLLDSSSTQGVTLPDEWGYISTGIETELTEHVTALLNQRYAFRNPQVQQFADLDNSRYQLSAFIRVKRPDGCPAQIHWSQPTPPFSIRPWYDNSPAPPVPIPLPDLLGDRTLLKTLKPSVAFNVPASLFDATEGMTLKDLLDGKKPASGGLGISWICGFNIPIITICAFIVLNIFLVLLNFIFGWLPFIKICVPIPQRSSGE